MNKIEQVILVILDGWGYAADWAGNAISTADTPNYNNLWRNYPHTLLMANGVNVGLSGHERGNSEVGHLNIGAGYVVTQDSSYIKDLLTKEELEKNKTMQDMIEYFKQTNCNINLMGLLSSGGIHSHIDHLYALLKYFSKINLKNNIYIHIFTDGRDSPTQEALKIISHLQSFLKEIKIGKIASVCGRYYAMDRDNRWRRTEQCYNALVLGGGKFAKTALSAVSSAYNQGETDEFISPTVIVDENSKPIHCVSDKDVLIFFNYRSDRARQLTMAFTNSNFDKFKRKKYLNDLFFVNMVPYGIEKEQENKNIHSLFSPPQTNLCLAQIISQNNLNQLHIAETEKYAHVTYFFNNGKEQPYPQEDRIMIPSPKVPRYDLAPEMSAKEVTKKMLNAIDRKKYSLVVVNYANGDMVGHTGNYEAAIKACEVVDEQIGKIIKSIDDETVLIITADHGNVDQMINSKTAIADTEHNANPVPFILYTPKWFKIPQLKEGMKLANIAPTILKILSIQIPKEMEEPIY